MSEAGNGTASPGPGEGAADPLLGTRVGNFRLVSRIGAGGMGVVYVAEHELMGKKAAVKLLLPELSTNKEIVGRFFNEARAATKINHPGIVDIYDFGYHGTGHAYIVMEFLAGESLAALMKRGLHFSRIVDIAWQLGSALGAAHQRGIVHRDVKPDNIFIIPDPAMPTGDRVKVLDFGIAKLTGEDGGPTLKTRTGAVIGTPVYMSPEQCKGSGEVDSRADIYAMGVIMFEMACGQPPFVRKGFGELITAHIVEAPPRLSALNPSVPTVYEAIVLRMLEKEPDNRYQTTEEVESDLATISAEAVAAVTHVPTVKADSTGRSKLRRRRLSGSNRSNKTGLDLDSDGKAPAGAGSARRKLLVAAMAAAVVGVAIAAVLAGGPKEPEAEGPAAPVSGGAVSTGAPAVVAPVKVAVTSTPSGAKVVRADDGALLGRTPYAASFPKSNQTMEVIVRQDGFSDQRVALTLREDSQTEITLQPLPTAAAPPAAGEPPSPPAAAANEKKSRAGHTSKKAGESKSVGAGTPAGAADTKSGKKKRNWGDLVDF